MFRMGPATPDYRTRFPLRLAEVELAVSASRLRFTIDWSPSRGWPQSDIAPAASCGDDAGCGSTLLTRLANMFSISGAMDSKTRLRLRVTLLATIEYVATCTFLTIY